MSTTNQSNQITNPSHCLPADQVEEFEAIAATNPTSLQDFLIRLNELQKQKSTIKI
jgi:hypothetical protein